MKKVQQTLNLCSNFNVLDRVFVSHVNYDTRKFLYQSIDSFICPSIGVHNGQFTNNLLYIQKTYMLRGLKVAWKSLKEEKDEYKMMAMWVKVHMRAWLWLSLIFHMRSWKSFRWQVFFDLSWNHILERTPVGLRCFEVLRMIFSLIV